MPPFMEAALSDLREQVRVGTLRRMREALADVDARLEGLRAERVRLVASIDEVEGQPPTLEPTLLAAVRLRADGALVVSAPGTPPTRIVAIRVKRARAAAQRVAELVEEALVERDRQP
jgi:hypothetical protein